MSERIYVQTNDAERNEVVAFDRAADGSLLGARPLRHGRAGQRQRSHLASQSSIVVSGDRLLVTNAGSDELSLFSVQPGPPAARRDRRERRRPPDERRRPRRAGVRAERRRHAVRSVGFSLAGGGTRAASPALDAAADATTGRPGADRVQPGWPHARRDRARHEQHQHLHGRRRRPRRRAGRRSRRRVRRRTASTSQAGRWS